MTSLEKYQALGNDFLILLDPEEAHPLDEAFVRRVCDRHHGVGADGVIRCTPGGRGNADLTFELRNSDGGPAEMSGNGIRCMVRAAVGAGMVLGPEVAVATDAGLKRVWVKGERVTVDMGRAELGPEREPTTHGWQQREVDMGNPHLVLLCPDPDEVDIAELGPRLERLKPDGINVEFISPGPGRDELKFRVWERGAGETQACGTGTCAAAAAANVWGIVGRNVTVHNPGGALEVTLTDEAALLTGPAEHVATVVLPA